MTGRSVRARHVDRNTEEIVFTSNGKVHTRILRVIGADQKTLTYISNTISDKGKPNVTIVAYEKQ